MRSFFVRPLVLILLVAVAFVGFGLFFAPAPSVSAQSTQPDCRDAGGRWERGADNTFQCVGATTCSESNPRACTTREACHAKGALWQNATGSAFQCVGSNQINCETGGGSWSNGRCNEAGGGAASSGTTTGTPSSQCSNAKTNTINFFRMPTWYQYLDYDPATCDVKFCVLGNNDGGCTKSSIPLVLLALIDIALRIGALVAVAFVIIGGIKFVTSQGEPDSVKSARNTVLNALVGLAIAIVATPVVVFIGTQLGK
jgi:hypothetical protein